MPVSTMPIQNNQILFVYCYGNMRAEDLGNWNVDGRISENNRGELTILVDLEDVPGTDMTFQDINAAHAKLTRHYTATGQVLRLVLFAPEDLTFGMTRIMQSLASMSESVKVDIARTHAELEAFLPKLDTELCDLRAQARLSLHG